MRVISAIQELKNHLKPHQLKDSPVGFVPTMGALHEGHLSLLRKSISENQVSVVSIFVNPLQFNNAEDLSNYPRVIEEDLEKLEQLDVDYVFIPDETELYPTKPVVSIHFGSLADVMEGEFRKDHFEGVGLVVSKLLHIVQPTNAYFGLKDLQQFLLIRRMCADLNFPTSIVGVETVREASGLAMSSRNRRLSPGGLEIASMIYKGLKEIEAGISKKIEVDELITRARSFYEKIDGLTIEYLSIVETRTLQKVQTYLGLNELAVCIAGYVEGVRLIDNLYLRLK